MKVLGCRQRGVEDGARSEKWSGCGMGKWGAWRWFDWVCVVRGSGGVMRVEGGLCEIEGEGFERVREDGRESPIGFVCVYMVVV